MLIKTRMYGPGTRCFIWRAAKPRYLLPSFKNLTVGENHMSNRILPAIAAVAALAISSVASAAVIKMNFFTGTWFNATGGPTSLNFSGNPGNNPQVRWGTAINTGQSGYNLDLAPPPGVPLQQNVPPNTSPFYIGLFTHVNQPILGSAITGIDLQITFHIVVDTTDTGLHNFLFHFTHDETPNGPPCPYGPPGLTGINANGCADAVTVSFLSASDTFLVGTVAYTLNLLGFSSSADCSGSISTQFLTMEQADNPARLCATIQTRLSVVPEPGTLLLLGLGIIGLTLARRRVHRLH